MVRIVLLAAALVAASAAPVDAWGHGGGHHDGRGFRHHRGGHVFVGVAFWGPGLWWFDYYPYPYYYPYPPPVLVEPAPPVVGPEPIQREVVYPGGKYVLYGDGVTQPWQWVWIPATAPPAPTPTP